MKLIIGLGNPGPRFAKTRHNVGFMVLDELARRARAKFKAVDRLEADLVEVGDMLLAKPLTFMNNSGRTVGKLMQKYRLADVLVVYDDVDTPEGIVRYRQKGSSGGHNGIKSIIEVIGQEFPRLKIGVGKRADRDTADYVLQKMTPKEIEDLSQTITIAADRIEKWDFHK